MPTESEICVDVFSQVFETDVYVLLNFVVFFGIRVNTFTRDEENTD